MSLHSDELEEVIGFTDFDMMINTDNSGDSSKKISLLEETSLCDLVADSIRDIGKGGSSLFCVRAVSCPQSVRGKNAGRDLDMIFFSQGTYLHFFRGHFEDRTVRGHKKAKSRKGEISMINEGSIRNDLHKGNITYNDVLEVLTFSSNIIVKQVKGQAILDAL